MPKFSARQAQIFIADLHHTLALFDEHSEGVTDAQALWSPDKETWSAVQLLAHLRSCQDVWANTIYHMRINDRPTLPDIHPRDWEKALRYVDQSYHESLEAFRYTRSDLLRVLEGLQDDVWQREATIGKRTQSIFGQVRRMALHEKNSHWEQITETLNAAKTSNQG